MNRFKPKAVRRSEAERQKAAEDFAREQALKAAERAEISSTKCKAGIHGSHTRHNCPNLPCNYCKKEGHIATTQGCPALMRKEAIPGTTQSYEGAHEASEQTSLNDYKITRRDSRWLPESKGFSPHFHCPGMSSVDGETMEAEEGLVYPTPDIHFPDLKDTLTCLVQKLSLDALDDLKFMDYPAMFRHVESSTQHIVDKAISLVEPEVLDFQGKTLTPQLFREAHEAQWLRTAGKSWSLEGGYVDGVLDDRNPKYARYYPGQSKGLPYRVYHDHAENIRNGSTHTLHYFVLARGRGHRHALFLRLWSTPSAPKGTKEADLNALMQNLLEMAFCRAFESLPADVLGDFFGPGTYSNVGLNNLPPLFQGRRVTATLRAKYAEYLRHSPDPDISAFVDIRRSQNAARRQPHESSGSLPRTSSVLEYRVALNELIQSLDLDSDSFAHWTDPVSCTLSTRFETDIADALRKLASDDEKPFVGPTGSALAKLGVVLDSEFADVNCVENYAEPLKGFRLSMENSLIWTSSFEGFGGGPTRARPDSPTRNHISDLNYSLITGSNLKVIILLGLRAQKDILSVFKNTTPAQLVHHEQHLFGPYQLPLQGCSICVWILCHGRKVSRIFIAGPEPPNVGSEGKYDNAKLTATRDTFGLAAAVSGERIRYTFWDSACFFASLLSQARLENEGVVEPLSSTDLAPVFRNWLSYKHFTDDDIKDLEQIAGGMTRGLLQVVTILRHWVHDKAGEEGTSSRSRGYRGKYDGPTYEKVKELFFRVAGIESSAKTQPQDAETQPQDMNLGTEGQINSEVGFLDSLTIDFMSGIMTEIARHAPEQVDEEHAELKLHNSQSLISHPRLLSTGSGVFNCTDTGASLEKSSPATCTSTSTAATTQVHGESAWTRQPHPPATPRQGPADESPELRARLRALLTETGTEQTIDRDPGGSQGNYWALRVCPYLFTFRVYPDNDNTLSHGALFSIRAFLSVPGRVHTHCFIPRLHEYKDYDPSDPAGQLALQYRLLDNHDGKGPSPEWSWATAPKAITRAKGLDFLFRANTFVDLLQGKSAQDLINVPRRSLDRLLGHKKQMS